MSTFFFRTWGGQVTRVTDVADVTFAPGHVVFHGNRGSIILAQANNDCLKLRQQLNVTLSDDEARIEYAELTK